MKLFSSSLFFMILFFSCNYKARQSSVLPQNKMTEVMWDMIRADQYVSDFLLKDTTKKKKTESIKLYAQIFHIHKITEEEFKKSLDYYSARPDLFRPIIDSLAKRRNSAVPWYAHPASTLPGQRKINKDSLNKHIPSRHLVKP